MNKLKYLNWDSNFFGYKVGRIIHDETLGIGPELFLKSIKKENYRLIYFFLPGPKYCKNNGLYEKGKSFVESIGGILVDKKIRFIYDLTKKEDFPDDVFLYNSHAFDDNLISIALQSGRFSRFLKDKNFENGAFKKLYKEWIIKSVTGEIADAVYVTKENEEITGLITLGLKRTSRVDIGLLAVDKKFRGKSFGSKLMGAAKGFTSKCNTNQIQVVTQGKNLPAVKFYQKCGFIEERTDYIYHIWI